MRLNDQQVRCLLIAGANKHLCHRSWLLDAFTVSSEYTHELEAPEKRPSIGNQVELEALKYPGLKLGEIVRLNKKFVGLISSHVNDLITVDILSDSTRPCFGLTDVFDVPASTVIEYFGSHPFSASKWGDTTVGRYVENIVCLQYPFEYRLFEYINERWKDSKILRLVKDAVLQKKATVAEFETFFNYAYFIGHITELNTPSMTVKSLQTNPKVPEIKKKFIEEHKGQMHDPMVIAELEKQLVQADRDYLDGDPSVAFFEGLGGKSFPVQRKKLFLTVGGIPAFGSESGGFDFIPNSLTEGWTKDAIPSIINEVRDGSYARGVETAKGGAETKLVMRVFQDMIVAEEDCGTKRTIDFDCRLFDAKQFIGRTIRVGNTDVVLTYDNYKKYAEGQVIHLYSPMTCETKFNLCYKCCGHRAKELHDELIGIQTVKITNGFMYKAMKSMHGTVLTVQKNKLEDILL